jgi:hypothetical protein
MKLKGITAQFSRLSIKVIIGANTNTGILTLRGTMTSLITNFKPSAIGCSRPQKPTTLGPFLL